jgi:hypothetical protein
VFGLKAFSALPRVFTQQSFTLKGSVALSTKKTLHSRYLFGSVAPKWPFPLLHFHPSPIFEMTDNEKPTS